MAAAVDQQQSALLGNLVPLNALSAEHLGQLVSRIQVESLESGAYLFREGDADHQHVYLLSGHVALLSGDREVDVIRSNSNTARFALAHQWPRKFSVRARTKVSIVRIDSRAISEMLVRTQTQSYRVSELASDSSGDWMSQVLRSRLFQQIPTSSIQNLLRGMESVSLNKGQSVIKEGEPGRHYYLLIKGECLVTRSMGGKVRELARLIPGDGFGEEALVTDLPRNASVSMCSNGMLMRVKKEDFVELISLPLLVKLGFEQASDLARKGAIWLDVSTPAEYATEHLRNAVNLPLNMLRKDAENLDGEEEYLVYGAESGEGMVGAFLLCERGFDAKVLQGGITAVPREFLIRAQDDAELREALSESATVPISDGTDVVLEASGITEQSNHLAGIDRHSKETDEIREQTARKSEMEVQQLRQSLDRVTAESMRITQNMDILQKENRQLKVRQEKERKALASMRMERDRQQVKMDELQLELDEVQEVLQEASAEESTHQWALTRAQETISRLEGELLEERKLNRILTEEREQVGRRLEKMRGKPESR